MTFSCDAGEIRMDQKEQKAEPDEGDARAAYVDCCCSHIWLIATLPCTFFAKNVAWRQETIACWPFAVFTKVKTPIIFSFFLKEITFFWLLSLTSCHKLFFFFSLTHEQFPNLSNSNGSAEYALLIVLHACSGYNLKDDAYRGCHAIAQL